MVPFMINITHLGIKPLAFTSGHGRYITATPERAFFFLWEVAVTHAVAIINLEPFHFRNGYVMAVSLLKPPCGGFRIETHGHLDPEVL
jgi:hypothetical protein